MPLYQRKKPETAVFILDKEGNGHELLDNILTGKVISKADLEKDWDPSPFPQ